MFKSASRSIFFAFIAALAIPQQSKGNASPVHVVELRDNDLVFRAASYLVYSNLRQKVRELNGKWTTITATDGPKLKDALENLDTTVPISHLIVNAHGKSDFRSISLLIGNDVIRFSTTDPADKNPLASLQGRFGDHPKIFLAGCSVFEGYNEDAEYKAGLVAEVLGLKKGEIFGSNNGHFILMNLAPPFSLSSFPRQFLSHFLLALGIQGSLMPVTKRENPCSEALMVASITALSLSAGKVLATFVPSLFGGLAHEGYVVSLDESGDSARRTSTDSYLYEDFLTFEDFAR